VDISSLLGFFFVVVIGAASSLDFGRPGVGFLVLDAPTVFVLGL
jgi:hypothetical protein